MTTTLSEGVKVPDVGSVNWAGDLEVNWNLLNGALANLSGNVKTDRDNTWTGEQTFSLPIVGSITGTASKAIADEDGTSIKTGYVNVAGNQTVTGSKDWSNLQTFSYSQIRIKSLSQEIGVTPSTSVIQYLEFADNNNVQHGKVGLWDYDNGTSEIQLSISDKYKNGVKDATGTSDTAFLSFGFQYNGTKFLTFSGQVNNSLIPLVTNAYALGSSSYQWRSIHVQNYYYNGTQWGLDQANVWTQKQTVSSTAPEIYLQNPDVVMGSSTDTGGCALCFNDSTGKTLSYMRQAVNGASRTIFEFCVKNTYKNGHLSNETGCEVKASSWYFGHLWNGAPYYQFEGGAANNMYPMTTGTYELGTSVFKWKAINGLNPGALSLPSSSYVDIDTTNWDLTGNASSPNWYMPTVDGWLCVIAFAGTMTDAWLDIWVDALWGQSASQSPSGELFCMIPVRANLNVRIRVKASSIYDARLFVASGNV